MDSPNLYARDLARLSKAIADFQDGLTPTIEFGGQVYGASDLDLLYQKRDRLMVKAAIEAIEGGAQSYQILGRTFTRGDLRLLYQRDQQLANQEYRRTASGPRVRNVVPV